MDVIGFWGANNKYGEFSNFYKSDFIVGGTKFNCVEQYMMYKKAELFSNIGIMRKIMESNNPKEIKQYGRSVLGFNPEIWDRHKYLIVLTAVRAKFSQNETLKQKLLSTGDKILAEASPYDKIWGIGTNKHSEVQDQSRWKGQNLLGKALMEVRQELKKK